MQIHIHSRLDYSFEQPTDQPGLVRGYDKPIMLAGGLGAIDPSQVTKLGLRPGDAVVVLGGPAMLIGLGGGAASSVASGQSSAKADTTFWAAERVSFDNFSLARPSSYSLRFTGRP